MEQQAVGVIRDRPRSSRAMLGPLTLGPWLALVGLALAACGGSAEVEGGSPQGGSAGTTTGGSSSGAGVTGGAAANTGGAGGLFVGTTGGSTTGGGSTGAGGPTPAVGCVSGDAATGTEYVSGLHKAWVPGGLSASQLCGIIIQTDFTGAEKSQYASSRWREFAAKMGFSMMLYGDYLPGLSWNFALLQTALNELESTSKLADYGALPLVGVGISNSGGAAVWMGWSYPDRYLGVIAHHGESAVGLAPAANQLHLPILYTMAQLDPVAYQRNPRIEDWYQKNRDSGALMTIALHYGANHSSAFGDAAADAFSLAWLESVIQQRLNNGQVVKLDTRQSWAGAYTLVDETTTNIHFDNVSFKQPFTLKSQDEVWLPSKAVAEAWKALY